MTILKGENVLAQQMAIRKYDTPYLLFYRPRATNEALKRQLTLSQTARNALEQDNLKFFTHKETQIVQ